ncbi:hypothetical protein E2C01_081726 [Portunus trituberculatus]|uniref:Uncharacterized protein n=1 Tax=Portunus trituberculatus TaxID=210409 RepID=A0A5B7J1W6_PORTR|nr:hypothetical protein [Portunus trituberculatus]
MNARRNTPTDSEFLLIGNIVNSAGQTCAVPTHAGQDHAALGAGGVAPDPSQHLWTKRTTLYIFIYPFVRVIYSCTCLNSHAALGRLGL